MNIVISDCLGYLENGLGDVLGSTQCLELSYKVFQITKATFTCRRE